MSVEITLNGTITLDKHSRKNIFCFKFDKDDNSKKDHIVVPEMDIFTEKHLFFSSVPKNQKFSSKVNEFKIEGNSQMTLLLSEMFFICKCIPKNEESIVLYIGAHPGDHINFLASMFNNLTFILYDEHKPDGMGKIGIDPYSENSILKNIEKNNETFDENKALFFKAKNQGKNIYLISDIRKESYGKQNDPKKNSDILNNDMYSQIRWCQIIKPKYALLKFRPKLPIECLTYKNELVDGNDTSENSKNLYFKYPEGIFLKLPFQKKTQYGSYFICNKYDLEKRYYHHDLISMMDYHHNHERKNVVFDNPFSEFYGMNVGIFSIEIIKKLFKKIQEKLGHLLSEDRTRLTEKEEDLILSEYAFGCGWDHRAAVYIGILHNNYENDKNDKNVSNQEMDNNLRMRIATKIITPLILMRRFNPELTDAVKTDSVNKN